MSKQRLIVIIIISIAVLLCNTPSIIHVWQFKDKQLTASGFDDLDASLKPPSTNDSQLTFELTNGNIRIYNQDRLIWENPADWSIQQAQMTDLNRDEQPEITMLVWRDFAPWPIDSYIPNPGRIEAHQNKQGKSCHIILMGYFQTGYADSDFRELWAGSALIDPLDDFLASDLDGDGVQELLTIESLYDHPSFLPNPALSVWEWNGFGFSLLDRAKAFFNSVQVLQNGHQTLIFTD